MPSRGWGAKVRCDRLFNRRDVDISSMCEKVAEAGEQSLAETGASHDLESSAWSSGRKGADLDVGDWRRLGKKNPSSLFVAGAAGGDHSRPRLSTAIVRRRRSSASTLAWVLPDSRVEEEAER